MKVASPIILIAFASLFAFGTSLHLTCSDDYSLHQLASVEAGLDHVCATEQRVSLVILHVVGSVTVLA